jgi:hypothetical protein
MAIRSCENLYPGVNAHLNSFLQNVDGEWETFHATFIVDLTRALNRVLPPQYEARNERSLQIRENVLLEGEFIESHRRKPDVTIYGTHAPVSGIAGAKAADLIPVVETMDVDDEAFLRSVVIRKIDSVADIGRPVTRIELLSPANKPPSAGYVQYRDKRNQGLSTGMPLIEIDFLHQSRPIAKKLPSYFDREPDATPYVIVVSDPRPSIYEGFTHFETFGVTDVVKKFDLPLEGADVLEAFDLTEAYNTTYANTPTYHRLLDYSLPPLQFDRYTAEDQHRILRHMQMISVEHSASP